MTDIDSVDAADGSTTLEVPDIETFDADELLLARMTIGVVRSGGAMFTGRLLECRVARILGARFPVVGISPWDLLTVEGVRVEVRSGGNSFSLRGPKQVDCWVFVHKLDESTPYTVASAEQVADLHANSITAVKLRARFGCVGADGLAVWVARVTEAAAG